MLQIVSTCFVVNTMQLGTTRMRILSASRPTYLQEKIIATIFTTSQAEKKVRHICDTISKDPAFTSDRENLRFPANTEHREQTFDKRRHVPAADRPKSLWPHHILICRALMRAGALLAFLDQQLVPGSASNHDSYHSHSTILPGLRSSADTSASRSWQVYRNLAFGSVLFTFGQ
jgi:hypothetical protein